jgi:transposase
MLETGEIGRFAKVGNFASYARCVDSQRLSNGKKKGSNNAKCGNPYLAWAFVEAANFAIRYSPRVKRFFERKCAKTNKIVAFKACAHKLARATFYVMRDRVAFDEARAFA